MENYLYKDALSNGEIYEIFIEKAYSELSTKDNIVIDIGGNIGDSAIFFAISGAQKVFSIEPQLKSYSSMLENIAINNLEKIIYPINAGVGQNEKYINHPA